MHISQLRDERVETVADAVREGEYVWVVVTDIKEGNKVSLSMRLVDQDTGELKEPLNDVDAAAPASAQIKFRSASPSPFAHRRRRRACLASCHNCTPCTRARSRGFNRSDVSCG